MRKKLLYENLDRVEIQPSFSAMLKWHKERRTKQKDLSYVVPHAAQKQIAYLQSNRTDTTVTWVGHATVLIQISGLNILTDPVWSNWMGFQKRLVPPGLCICDVPPIDVVLISHNHYDHLSFSSIKRLPGQPVYLVPAGLRDSFRKKGFDRAEEFNWWESKKAGRVSCTFVPAQHWSSRTLLDRNKSLWGGWVITKAGGESIYFAGDSGYFRGFREIGEKFNIKCVLMPIGAYDPEWFMHRQHVSPEQAVKAYLDLKADNFVPVHYEAFRLGDDTPEEALHRLKAQWTKEGLYKDLLKILHLGETIIL